jgi:hypothetical protein
MAKLILSSLVDQISGKFNGDVIQTWRGITYRRKGTSPRNPRTVLQASTRQSWSYLSGSYDSLSVEFKADWDYYATLLTGPMSGFNSFMQLNQRLLSANYTTLVKLYDAPSEYTPPAGPEDFALTYNSTYDRWEATWSTPADYDLFVQTEISAVTGYRDTLFPAWALFDTVPSADGIIYIDASVYAAGTQMRARARVINQNGEVSAYTATLTAIKE